MNADGYYQLEQIVTLLEELNSKVNAPVVYNITIQGADPDAIAKKVKEIVRDTHGRSRNR